MTGYDLKKTFDDTIDFFWSAQMSQIYRELNNLEEKGLVKSKIEPQEKRPDRKVYKLTEEGRKTFLNWLNKFPNGLSQHKRSRFLMRIFFSSRIQLDELAFEMTRYKKEKEKILKYLSEVENQIKDYSIDDKYKSETFYWELILRKGYKENSADIEWVEECLKLIKEKQKDQ
jgi:PadR family transcriptional regulator AphA